MESTRPSSKELLTLPRRTLLALCGPAGSGKSTFAQRLVDQYSELGLRPTTIVSSDVCRALVCDDENNQQVNRDSFDLFHYILHKRMLQSCFTIADSTALQADARRRMLQVAQRHGYSTCLLVFNISQQTCVQRDQRRRRLVGEAVIAHHISQLARTLLQAPSEGWNQISLLEEQHPDITLEILTN